MWIENTFSLPWYSYDAAAALRCVGKLLHLVLQNDNALLVEGVPPLVLLSVMVLILLVVMECHPLRSYFVRLTIMSIRVNTILFSRDNSRYVSRNDCG